MVRLYVCACVLIMSITGFAQAYYVQIDNIEPFISPSLNGMSPLKDLRFSASYRSNNLNMSSPFHTTYLTVDGRAFARYLNNRAWIGWGVSGLYDIAGVGHLTTTSLYANLAYHQMVSPIVLVSGGIGVGLNSKILNNLSELSFPIQWTSAFFDKSIPNREVGLMENTNSLDFRLGANVSILFSRVFVLTGGLSVSNINEPIEKFYTTERANGSQKIPAKYTLFAQSYHNINEIFAVKNSMMFSRQGEFNRLVVGSSWEWSFSNYYDYVSLLFGAYYRMPDILTPSIGIKFQDFRFTMSFDVFMNDFSTIDYFYRLAAEANANYNIKLPNNTFENLITICPGHF